MGFSRQEYWSGLPFPSPGDLPDPGIEPGPLTLQADALTSEPPEESPNLITLREKVRNIFATQRALKKERVKHICLGPQETPGRDIYLVYSFSWIKF